MERELASEPASAETAPARKRCALQDAVARVEACAGAGCPFWEEGGAVLEAGCLIERLSLDLARRPELAQNLLELRLRLARGPPGAQLGRSLFYRLRAERRA